MRNRFGRRTEYNPRNLRRPRDGRGRIFNGRGLGYFYKDNRPHDGRGGGVGMPGGGRGGQNNGGCNNGGQGYGTGGGQGGGTGRQG